SASGFCFRRSSPALVGRPPHTTRRWRRRGAWGRRVAPPRTSRRRRSEGMERLRLYPNVDQLRRLALGTELPAELGELADVLVPGAHTEPPAVRAAHRLERRPAHHPFSDYNRHVRLN